MSRIAHDKMVRAALIVLDHAIHEAEVAPIKPSPGLRFALSWLFANSTGERGCFSDFLLALQNDTPMMESAFLNDTVRRTHIDTCFKGIIRCVGYPETVAAAHDLTAGWKKG